MRIGHCQIRSEIQLIKKLTLFLKCQRRDVSFLINLDHNSLMNSELRLRTINCLLISQLVWNYVVICL